tara:strand:+ start:62140 stop:62910 length:771 start_codon:yes stop_codon:yes gene_type:complete
MYQGKKILSIVIARAGSKGIKLKNVRPLLDQPLFMWSVGASLQSKYIDFTVVSSNCPYVKEEYEDFVLLDDWWMDEDKEKSVRDKIAWIDRPDELATPTSKNEDAMIHTVEFLEKKDMRFDSVVTLQPTSPIRNNGLIDKCVEEYYDGHYDSLVTGKKDTPFMWRKIRGQWVYDVDVNDCCNRKMRQGFQEHEWIYHDDGNVYISDVRMLLETKCRLGIRTCFYETDKLQSLQIDEEIDFQLIENIVNLKGMKSLI